MSSIQGSRILTLTNSSASPQNQLQQIYTKDKSHIRNSPKYNHHAKSKNMNTQTTLHSGLISNAQQKQQDSFTMFEILPQLYLSKFPTTIPEEITHVLNMCTHPHPIDTSRSYLHIPLNDIDDIKPEIPSIITFIDGALSDPNSKNKVLVHCALGLNRSVAAVLAYVCHTKKIRASEGLEWIKEKKGDVKPCALFVSQINDYNGWKEEGEDPMVRFHRRLQARKDAARIVPSDSRES